MPTPNPTTPLGPFRGINNVEDELSLAYVVGENSPAYLREAVNVDLTRDGWIRSRVGQAKKLTLTDAHSLIHLNSGTFFVDNGGLYQYHPDNTTSLIRSGLDNGLMSYESLVGGDVFYCNGVNRGRIINGEHKFWGLVPPAPSQLTQTTGNLPAGEYMVALTWEVDGVESGTRHAATITLTETAGIEISQILPNPYAEYINIYLTNTNGKDLYWAKRIEVAATATVVDLAQSTDVLDSMHFYPPPQGARIVRLFKGRLLVVAGNALYWSQPLAPHWFDLAQDVQLFAEEPRLVEVVDNGFYLAEGERTWWVAGDDPSTWQPTLVDNTPVCSGRALRIPGRKIPALETTAMVVVWVTASGPVVGLPGGLVAHLTDRTLAINPNQNATLSYREENGLSQILMNLKNKTASSGFGATDRATCTITKANLASN
jgi:hypothetical protein